MLLIAVMKKFVFTVGKRTMMSSTAMLVDCLIQSILNLLIDDMAMTRAQPSLRQTSADGLQFTRSRGVLPSCSRWPPELLGVDAMNRRVKCNQARRDCSSLFRIVSTLRLDVSLALPRGSGTPTPGCPICTVAAVVQDRTSDIFV